MNFLISGGSGFIGSALSAQLAQQGHYVVVLSRHPESIREPARGIAELSQLAEDQAFDVVINLAGEPIADKRWSAAQKLKIVQSRLRVTQEIVTWMQGSKHKPRLFISGSAIGYYGVGSGDESIGEDIHGDDSFSSQLCRQWEGCALQAQALGIRTCLLRIGIVLGNSGGVLAKMLPPFKLGVGGRIGSGQQWMSWVHVDDILNIIAYCVSQESLSGPINCTAPVPVRNQEFTRALGTSLRRPTWLPLPRPVISLLMGEMGEELLLAGKKVLPQKLQEAGYSFQFEQIDAAFADIFLSNGKPKSNQQTS